MPLPTDTPMAPADTPTEVPTMMEPTQPVP
jgi:hypothetical protein